MTKNEHASKPLILDVDGTFLKTDMLLESFWQAMGQHPLACLGICVRHFSNRARLKKELAGLADLRLDLLPVNSQIAELARQSQKQGRQVLFASGSDETLVRALAEEHGIDQPVFASDGEVNLTGARKAAMLSEAYGKGGFDYAGDGPVDEPVWQAAENAIIVGEHPEMAKSLATSGSNVEEFGGGWRKRDLIRALRPHQWVKNVLLFLPLIAAHRIDTAGLLIVLFAAIAFSLAASTIYIVNDLLDLEADRLHPTKCRRPFASGAVPILVGMITALGIGVFALALAFAISWSMLGIVALYMSLSLAYSLKLKRMRWVDIATLAALYTLRVIAGAIAAKVLASGFLVAFIFPTFITLGCVKRLTELTLATTDERLPGRGYGRSDRGDLLNVAGLGMVGSLLVFFLYSFTDAAAALYPNVWQLWLAMIPLAGWQVRMVMLGWKGRMDYDPIVFAMRDKYGLALIALMLTVMFTAADGG
jgi:4-hydroxybenzoate polyprenyltransferase